VPCGVEFVVIHASLDARPVSCTDLSRLYDQAGSNDGEPFFAGGGLVRSCIPYGRDDLVLSFFQPAEGIGKSERDLCVEIPRGEGQAGKILLAAQDFSALRLERDSAEDGNDSFLLFPFSFVWRQFGLTLYRFESVFEAGAFPVFRTGTAKAMTMARF